MYNLAMKIKKATAEDCKYIAEVFNNAHMPFETVLSEEEVEVMGGDLHKTEEDCIFMMEGREVYCVRNGEEKIVAYVSFRKKNNETVWISELYVDPEYQGKGVGKMVIDFVSEFGRTNKCLTVALETHQKADWAIGFYLKLGFEIVNEKINEIPFCYILDKPPVPNRPILAKII